MTRLILLLTSVAMLLTFLALDTSPAVRAQTNSYAFVDANLVMMTGSEVHPHQTVVVVDDRIVAIGPAGQVDLPANVIIIDAAGRYLMPGLVDAHIHLVSEHDLPLLLSYGVTTVRNMNGRPQHLAWRGEVAGGQRLGPRIITAGPMLGELPLHLRAEPDVNTGDAIVEQIIEQKSLGYDFIKVGDGLSSSELAVVVAAARQQGMDVAGHMPDGMRFSDVLSSGLRSIEHLDGLAGLSADALALLLPEIAAEGVWFCPTLTIWQHFEPVDGEESHAQIALADYVENTGRASRCLVDASGERSYALSRPSAHSMALVSQLHSAGVPLLLGTDAPFLCATPGISVHQELRNSVETGLSPYEALRTATANPALFLGELDDLGTVEVGKRADLLLVGGNPLEDVSAVQEIEGIMVQGKWLPVERLQELRNPGL